MSKNGQLKDGDVLGRAALLAAATPQIKTVAIEHVGQVAMLRLSVRRRKEWADKVMALPPERGMDGPALLIIASLVDGQGSPMFTDADIDTISDLEQAVVQRLFDEIQAFNGLGPAQQEIIAKN